MNELDDVLRASTQNISSVYFQLPIAGADDAIYRERVYCYELYHQMRMRWPPRSSYSLGGEVDKSGHPLIRGNGLDNLKPDLLVHIPGDMGGNYAVIEVKPVTATPQGIRKDLDSMRAFLTHARYSRALLLIYGTKRLEDMVAPVTKLLREDAAGIEVWIHTTTGEPASRVKITV